MFCGPYLERTSSIKVFTSIFHLQCQISNSFEVLSHSQWTEFTRKFHTR
eukprot:UN15247